MKYKYIMLLLSLSLCFSCDLLLRRPNFASTSRKDPDITGLWKIVAYEGQDAQTGLWTRYDRETLGWNVSYSDDAIYYLNYFPIIGNSEVQASVRFDQNSYETALDEQYRYFDSSYGELEEHEFVNRNLGVNSWWVPYGVHNALAYREHGVGTIFSTSYNNLNASGHAQAYNQQLFRIDPQTLVIEGAKFSGFQFLPASPQTSLDGTTRYEEDGSSYLRLSLSYLRLTDLFINKSKEYIKEGYSYLNPPSDDFIAEILRPYTEGHIRLETYNGYGSSKNYAPSKLFFSAKNPDNSEHAHTTHEALTIIFQLVKPWTVEQWPQS